MSEHTSATPTAAERVARGYGGGDVSTVISVEDVVRQVQAIAGDRPTADALSALAGERPFLTIESLRAGYGKLAILHDFALALGRGPSLCLIGPNGAGQPTVAHSIFVFTNVFSGPVTAAVRGGTRRSP